MPCPGCHRTMCRCDWYKAPEPLEHDRSKGIPRLPRLAGYFVRAPRVCGEYTVNIDESDHQMICLALAREAIRCPGWEMALREIAAKLPNGAAMFNDFLNLEKTHAK